MSAWYIMSALGFYQVEPAGGKYIIGSPLFDKATIDLGSGKTFTVVAKGNSTDNIYRAVGYAQRTGLTPNRTSTMRTL